MPTTVSDLIHSSFRLIGAVVAAETLETNELNDALVTLNQMIDVWSDEDVSVYAIKKDTFGLNGASSYSMGPGGIAGTVRPTQVVAARAYSGTYGRALKIVGVDRWTAIAERGGLLNLPLKAFIDYAFPLATVWLWPAPVSGVTVELYTVMEYAVIPDVPNAPVQHNFQPQRLTYTVPGSTGSFTVGPGGQLATTRPAKCNSIAVSSGGFRHELDIVAADEWATLLESSGSPIALPLELYVEYSFPSANLNVWPASGSGSVDIHSLQQITHFAALADTVNLPPGYEQAIRYNLAVLLAPEYGRPIDQVVAASAQQSKASIVQMNAANNMRRQQLAAAPAA
jgi:hypothetical protein